MKNPIKLMATGNFCPPPMIFENVQFPQNNNPKEKAPEYNFKDSSFKNINDGGLEQELQKMVK